jgi:hypothetical protein
MFDHFQSFIILTIMQKTRLLLTILILIIVSNIRSQTITSTTTGGNWEDASTWVGGVVPNQGNDVIINGTVSVTSSNSVCKNITINSGKFLQNGGGLGWVWLRVFGNITNNGTLRNNPVANTFVIDLRGDIVNNGTWILSETHIATKQVQHISQSAGTVFEGKFYLTDWNGAVDTNGKLIASSGLTFNNSFDLRWFYIDMNGNSLTLKAQGGLFWGTIRNASDIYLRDSSYFFNTIVEGTTTTLHGIARIDGNVHFYANIINADTMQHTGGLGWVTPVFYGNLTNNGLIRNNPVNNWGINLDIRGDIHNNGIWRPGATYIATKKLQHISQTTGKIFENQFTITDGNGYVDTNGSLIATSPLTFSHELYMNWRYIDMDSFPVTMTAAGHLSWGTIKNASDIYFRDSSYFYNTIAEGKTIHLHGIIRIDGNVTFNGDVIVHDTMQHTGGLGWVTPTFNGSVTNNGLIRNNPINNWGLNLRIHKNIANNGLWNAQGVILDGISRRNVDLRGAITGVTVEGKKVIFEGVNYVPTLAMTSAAICYVASEGTLLVLDGTTNYGWNGVGNLGKIIIPQKTVTGTTKYAFYSGHVYFHNGATLPDSVVVESYGTQTPKNFGNSVSRWWRIRTVPNAPIPQLQYLDLYYAQTDVNGIPEKDFRLYRSIDNGTNWTQIEDAKIIYHDTSGNYMRIEDVPCSGDYLLAAGGTTPTPARPNIRVSVIGNPELRVLAPNRQVVNMYNNSDAPSGDFFITLEVNEGLRILKTEDEMDGFTRTYSVNDILEDSADQYASFYIRSLGPREERDFTVYATSKTPSYIKSNDQKPQLFWFIGIAAVYVVGAYATDYVTDKMVQGCFDLWAPQGGATEEQKKLAAQTISEAAKEHAKKAAISTGKQLAEDGAGKILEHSVLGKLIWPVKMSVNILSCFENTMKGLQCYLGQKPIKDVFTHVECNGSQKQVTIITSRDPNHKSGPTGYGQDGFIASTQRMEYMIECENAPDAAAAAYQIVIIDSLAPEFDESSVVFGRMSHKFTPSRNGRFLKWEITGIDLPPNKVPTEGEAWVTYSVMPKAGLPTGTKLGNRASITFDVNPPIITNTHVNTLDYAPPSTTMQALPSKTNDTVVTVRWTSNDGLNGSGYESATLYMAKDDGEYVAVCNQNGDSAQIILEYNHTYSFFALAKDNVGNLEMNRPIPVNIRASSGVQAMTNNENFWLRDVYPNPVRDVLYIDYSLARSGQTTVIVIDELGRIVSTLLSEFRSEDVYTTEFNTSQLRTGTYYIRLDQGGAVSTKKFVVVK